VSVSLSLYTQVFGIEYKRPRRELTDRGGGGGCVAVRCSV